MPVERARVIPLFKSSHLFAGLGEAELSKAARYFREVHYEPQQVIFAHGDVGTDFYFIAEGEVAIHLRQKEASHVDVLGPGDYFGEESLLTGRHRGVTAVANTPVTVLASSQKKFRYLLDEFPDLRRHLAQIMRSRVFVRGGKFNWLNHDEIAYLVQRRHIFALAQGLLVPLPLLLLGSIIIAYGLLSMDAGVGKIVTSVIGGLILLAGLLLAGWRALDWSNDYYLITDQRVVSIEKVILTFDSRDEAPMDAIRSVDTRTSFWGRTFGFGDVLIATYTGQLILGMIPYPKQAEALVREFIGRSRQLEKLSHKLELENSVRKMVLGPDAPLIQTPVVHRGETAPGRASGKTDGRRIAKQQSGDVVELSLAETWFGGWFRIRYQSGNVITYRKHWLILLKRIGKPLALVFFTLFLLVIVISSAVKGFMDTATLLIAIAIIVVLSIPAIGWLVYNYFDWANDVYQLTPDSLFDIERKPLGTENRTSTPLDKIISLSHERKGFIGYLFDVGDVVIKVGDSSLTFDGVFRPAQVQRDVSQYRQALDERKKREKDEEETSRLKEYIETYHRVVQQIEDSDQDMYEDY